MSRRTRKVAGFAVAGLLLVAVALVWKSASQPSNDLDGPPPPLVRLDEPKGSSPGGVSELGTVWLDGPSKLVLDQAVDMPVRVHLGSENRLGLVRIKLYWDPTYISIDRLQWCNGEERVPARGVMLMGMDNPDWPTGEVVTIAHIRLRGVKPTPDGFGTRIEVLKHGLGGASIGVVEEDGTVHLLSSGYDDVFIPKLVTVIEE